ncbi:hypothetical protein [Nonomuraea sp. NPDC049480]|uniref:hypothetical protein n=1 Tax=Nonomuraea sp. NPDC049480 TaxID=3364353 RepID=UPI00378D46F9
MRAGRRLRDTGYAAAGRTMAIRARRRPAAGGADAARARPRPAVTAGGNAANGAATSGNGSSGAASEYAVAPGSACRGSALHEPVPEETWASVSATSGIAAE